MQGLPVGEIDLQYRSELIKAIQPDVENGRYLIKFVDEKNELKARGFEKRKNKQVFYASEDEANKALDFITEKLFQSATN